VSLTLLPADWRRWLLQRVEHGEKPADLLRHLSAQGHLTAHAALLAVNEALAKTAANRHHDATAGGLRPRLNTDRRLLNVQGRSVLVRATLDCSGLAVLDDLLDGYECAELCVAAEREAVDSVAGASVRAGLGRSMPASCHPFIELLAARLSGLVDWPLARFQPLQIRRLRSGDLCRPRSESARPGQLDSGRGGPIVGSFVVYLDTPAHGGAIGLPGAMGLRVLPQTGTAIWFDHQGPGGADAAALQVAAEPAHNEPPWVVIAWLHAQDWR